MSRLWDRLDAASLSQEMQQIFARARAMEEHDRAGGPFPLNTMRASDVPDGTIVRCRDGEVGFVEREMLLDQEKICLRTGTVGYYARPDEQIDVILTPTELAAHFITSRIMQDGCRISMLIAHAVPEVLAAQGEVLDEPVTDPRRQALDTRKQA